MSYCTCGVLLLLMILVSVCAYPWTQSRAPSALTDCDTKDEIQILCQRCAKSTKSNMVYPMCCTDEEEARTWCFHYTNFGIQGV